MITITGYYVERTGEFYSCEKQVNGNMERVRIETQNKHDSEIYFRLGDPPKSDFEKIVQVVKEFYDMTKEDVFQKTRRREILEPRQIIQYLAMKRTTLSLTKVGRLTGTDHATVYYSTKAIDNRLFSEPSLRANIRKINEELDYMQKLINLAKQNETLKN